MCTERIFNLNLKSFLEFMQVCGKAQVSYLFNTLSTEYLLQKVEFESLTPDKKIPLIQSAAEEIDTLREKLLSGNQLEQYSVARLLIIVCELYPSITYYKL